MQRVYSVGYKHIGYGHTTAEAYADLGRKIAADEANRSLPVANVKEPIVSTPVKKSGCLLRGLKILTLFYLVVALLFFASLIYCGMDLGNALAMAGIWPFYLPLVLVMGLSAGG